MKNAKEDSLLLQNVEEIQQQQQQQQVELQQNQGQLQQDQRDKIKVIDTNSPFWMMMQQNYSPKSDNMRKSVMDAASTSLRATPTSRRATPTSSAIQTLTSGISNVILLDTDNGQSNDSNPDELLLKKHIANLKQLLQKEMQEKLQLEMKLNLLLLHKQTDQQQQQQQQGEGNNSQEEHPQSGNAGFTVVKCEKILFLLKENK